MPCFFVETYHTYGNALFELAELQGEQKPPWLEENLLHSGSKTKVWQDRYGGGQIGVHGMSELWRRGAVRYGALCRSRERRLHRPRARVRCACEAAVKGDLARSRSALVLYRAEWVWCKDTHRISSSNLTRDWIKHLFAGSDSGGNSWPPTGKS